MNYLVALTKALMTFPAMANISPSTTLSTVADRQQLSLEFDISRI
jgi:hypothetical protein